MYSSFSLLAAIATAIEPLQAQTAQSPPPVRLPRPDQQTIPTPEPAPILPPPEQILQPPASNSTTSEEIPNVQGTVVIKKFEVLGSTVFSAEEFDQVTAEFTNRPITFAELLQARTAVTKLYISRGYITSGAFIPPQTLSEGIAKIQVLEGGLEDIKVTGTQRLNPNYVRSRLEIATGKPLNRDRLIEALQLLQLNPLISTLSAELSAGTRPGENLLEVKVTEAKTFNARLSADNQRSPSVGSFRRGVEISEANLFGQGDSITVGYTNTDGSNDYDFSYTYPINPRNGTLSFSYRNINSRVIEEPFNALDIKSSSRYYDLTLRQPLLQTPTREFAIGLTGSYRESESSLLNTPFPLSPGANAQGRTSLGALRFFQEYIQRGSREVLAFRSQINAGIAPFAITANDTPVDQFFLSWRGQGQYVNLFAPDTLFLVRADVQLANKALVPIEQIGIGGQESVRGYRQDLLLTDNGATATAELRLPILRIPEVQGVLQFVPFFDLGIGWNNSGRTNPNPNTLAGVGVGLRWQQSDRLTIRFDYGIPLSSVNTEKRNWQENGLYFSLIWNPF